MVRCCQDERRGAIEEFPGGGHGDADFRILLDRPAAAGRSVHWIPLLSATVVGRSQRTARRVSGWPEACGVCPRVYPRTRAGAPGRIGCGASLASLPAARDFETTGVLADPG